jgi:hypothetical protein
MGMDSSTGCQERTGHDQNYKVVPYVVAKHGDKFDNLPASIVLKHWPSVVR